MGTLGNNTELIITEPEVPSVPCTLYEGTMNKFQKS
jgi:hypothetical protein